MRQQGRTSPRTPYSTEYRNRKGFSQTISSLDERVRGVELRPQATTAPVAGSAFGLEVRQDGVFIGTRSIIDFLTGANVTLTSGDDGIAISVEIASTGGGGGAPSGPAGGELSGTYPNPSVAASHSGSTHAATQAAAEATAATALAGHVAAADPHTGYRLESADHSHASSGLQGGTVAHSALSGIGANDHHAQSHTHASHTGIGADDHHAQSHAITSHTGGTAVLVADASWIDLTDGGATTLHSHAGGGSVATDAIWDAAGDLVQGTGPDAAARIAGVQDAILQYTGATTAWQTHPQIGFIADTTGVDRITLDATGSPVPHVLITGDLALLAGTVYLDFAGMASPSFPNAQCALLIGDSLDDYNSKMGIGVFLGNSFGISANNIIGVAGKAQAVSNTTTTPIGLDFQANHVAHGTGTKTIVGVRIGSVVTGISPFTGTANVSGILFSALTLAGTHTAINYVALNITASSSSRLTSWKALSADMSSANAATLVKPIEIRGPARTTDTDGSYHQPNWQFASITRAFAGGDGVVGLANRTTAPTATPAGGIVLFAADAQRLMMRGNHAVNETVVTTLAALAAGTAYASSNTETALNNALFNFPANALVAGAVYRITARGVYSDTLTPTFQLRVRWGGVAGVLLGDGGAVTMGVSQTNVGWHVEFIIRVVSIGATGTVECQGNFAANTTAVLATFDHLANAAVITIDTTAAKDLVLTGTWSANSASNTLTVRQFILERIA